MLSKKILIDGAEAYLQSNKNPAGEVSLDWIINSVHRRISISRIDYNLSIDEMLFEYLRAASEITDLNGFDYSQPDPDYSLIKSVPISLDRIKSYVKPDPTKFRVQVALSAVTSVGIYALNGAWRKEFGALAQEDIVDFQSAQFRQPFYIEIETGVDSIIINNAWGGDANLQYSIDGGANWQAGNSFTSLTPGDYQVVAKDGLGNESTVRQVTIVA